MFGYVEQKQLFYSRVGLFQICYSTVPLIFQNTHDWGRFFFFLLDIHADGQKDVEFFALINWRP
jgi:hypothetical protein